MEKTYFNGAIWWRADHVSILVRRHYYFRRIGKILYCRPIK